MDISIYFEPLELPEFQFDEDTQKLRLGDIFSSFNDKDNFPGIDDVDIAIIGVNEDRNAVDNEGCALAPDAIRSFLYKLFRGNYKARIADLGNIKKGHKVEDTYFAVSAVVSELIKNKVIPIILGGSQDLSFANYRAYESLGQIINIVGVDSIFDLGKAE